MATIGYIRVELPQRIKQRLGNLVTGITKPTDLYYSDVIPHIQGDVTYDLHFTLFFGLKSAEIENPALLKYVKGIKIDKLELGPLTLAKGYKGMYQVLSMKIKDNDGSLLRLSKEFLNFDCDSQMLHDDFNPHVTLAYVTANYEIPAGYVDYDIKAKPRSIKICKFEDN